MIGHGGCFGDVGTAIFNSAVHMITDHNKLELGFRINTYENV